MVGGRKGMVGERGGGRGGRGMVGEEGEERGKVRR